MNSVRVLGSRAERLGTKVVRAITASVFIVTVAAVTVLTSLLVQQHHDSAQVSAKSSALQTARESVPLLLSYKASEIDRSFAMKYSLLTGKFLNDFRQLSEKTLIPSAKERGINTEAKVVQAAVIDNSGDSASVLVFVNQSTTTSADASPVLDGSRVRVNLAKVDDDWKISGMQPV